MALYNAAGCAGRTRRYMTSVRLSFVVGKMLNVNSKLSGCIKNPDIV